MSTSEYFAPPQPISQVNNYSKDSHNQSTQGSRHLSTSEYSIAEMVYQQGQLTKLLLDHNLKADLPARQIEPFDGDPIKWPAFQSAFEFCIEEKVKIDKERIQFLDQFTRGEANVLVRSCMSANFVSYADAKSQLQRKFGNKHKVVEAYLKKLREYPEIKGGDGPVLHRYALILIECRNTLSGLDCERELDNTASIKALVAKLPYRLRDRWRATVDYIEEEKGNVVRYSDFVTFVDKQARIATNPAYGNIAADKEVKGQRSPKARHTSMATNVNPAGDTTQEPKKSKQNDAAMSKPCMYCNGTHSMEGCRKSQLQID